MGRGRCSKTMHDLLQEVRAHVDQVLRWLRPFPGPLAIESSAGILAVDLSAYPFRNGVEGAAIRGRSIILATHLRGTRRREVFAHEVAHILVWRRQLGPVPRPLEEAFAEQFARELLVPRSWLQRRHGSVASLAAEFGVTRATIALQLAVLGHAPEVMRDGGRVLCATCGVGSHIPSCECARYRQGSRATQRRLPELRHLRDGRRAVRVAGQHQQLELAPASRFDQSSALRLRRSR
jgi:Zn-dependent peptidase ImmA (M78 family)